MTSAVLQCLAILTMAVDHIGYRILPGMDIFRMIGRLSFPLFAFLLAEGFVHTGNRKKYFLRLGAFALISEVPYQIFAHWNWVPYLFAKPWTNIFFELLLMFLSLVCMEKARKENRLWYLGAAVPVVLAEVLGTMYGPYGVLLGICFYAFRDKKLLAFLGLGVLTGLYCWQHQSLFQIYAIAAAIPLWFYNGERGPRLPRYFSYVFYPAHLLVIYGVDCLLKQVTYY